MRSALPPPAVLAAIAFICALPACVLAQTAATDTLVLTSGERRQGRITAVDAGALTVEVQIAPGQPMGSIRIARPLVASVEFAPDPARDALLARATTAQIPDLAALWQHLEPLLPIARSAAPTVGLRYGEILLRSAESAHAAQALALFSKIEQEAWNPPERAAAAQGRLRSLVAVGKTEEAAAEAREIIKGAPSTALLCEAKLILAKATEGLLRSLLDQNPRWEQDERVRPERDRLYHEALDSYLYPSLFAGAVSEPAARGLWGAIGIYQLTGEEPLAREAAQDILHLHPSSSAAKSAQTFLANLSKTPADTAPSAPPTRTPQKP